MPSKWSLVGPRFPRRTSQAGDMIYSTRLILAFALVVTALLSCGQAAPVTGWLNDPVANPNSPGITGADTASPVWGSGAADSTNGTAIYASFPAVTLVNNRRLTLSATAQLVGSNSTNEQFRFGLLGSNG